MSATALRKSPSRQGLVAQAGDLLRAQEARAGGRELPSAAQHLRQLHLYLDQKEGLVTRNLEGAVIRNSSLKYIAVLTQKLHEPVVLLL